MQMACRSPSTLAGGPLTRYRFSMAQKRQSVRAASEKWAVGLWCLLSLCLAGAPTRAEAANDILILTSSDIIPYSDCITGIRNALTTHPLQVVNLGEDIERGREVLQEAVEDQPPLVIAVGPQAAFLLAKEPRISGRLFCMVLNPLRLFGGEALCPGVSLNIPPRLQLETVSRAFPGRKRVGIVYSPEKNQPVIDDFAEQARTLELPLLTFPVASASQLPEVLASERFAVDVLLVIPDDVLASTRIVQYLIEEALRRKIPVVGYNSWFAANGAVLSFMIDYEAIGVQTAGLAGQILAGESVTGIAPPETIRISIDLKTAQKLGIDIATPVLTRAHEVKR